MRTVEDAGPYKVAQAPPPVYDGSPLSEGAFWGTG